MGNRNNPKKPFKTYNQQLKILGYLSNSVDKKV